MRQGEFATRRTAGFVQTHWMAVIAAVVAVGWAPVASAQTCTGALAGNLQDSNMVPINFGDAHRHASSVPYGLIASGENFR